jgi:preprotein translocase subunit SecF
MVTLESLAGDLLMIKITLAVVVGILLAIVFALRMLVIVDRRLERMEQNQLRWMKNIAKTEETQTKMLKSKKKKK